MNVIYWFLGKMDSLHIRTHLYTIQRQYFNGYTNMHVENIYMGCVKIEEGKMDRNHYFL